MICGRCGSECSERPSGYCLHCQIAVDLEEALGVPLAQAGVQEGFPDYKKPSPAALREAASPQRRLF